MRRNFTHIKLHQQTANLIIKVFVRKKLQFQIMFSQIGKKKLLIKHSLEHFECVVNKQLWHSSRMVTFFTQLNSRKYSKATRITRNKYYDELVEFLNFCSHKHIPSCTTLSCMGVPKITWPIK